RRGRRAGGGPLVHRCPRPARLAGRELSQHDALQRHDHYRGVGRLTAMDAIISPLAPEPPAAAARADRPTALSVENVSAAYGKSAPAIEDISFAVKTGERVAVVGPNGAGKSTLFNVIAGLLPALKGRVQVHGHTHQAGDCVSVGYVPQRENVDWRFPLT